jgi:ABC-2 type transport system permease protein
VRLFVHQFRNEQRLYWRSHELAFFTFLFPVLLFLLLSAVYGDSRIKAEHDVRASGYLLAGMLGYALASTAFAGLAIVLVLRRENGILKRVRATPLPSVTYLGAEIVSTTVVYAISAVVLIVLARTAFHVHLRTQWLSLVLTLALGALAFAGLGVALTGFIRSGDGASAVVNVVYLPTSFLSGAFWTPHSNRVLEVIAEVLPLTHFIRLTRDVVLLDRTIWSDWREAIVVAAWGLGGLVLAIRAFRWEPRQG